MVREGGTQPWVLLTNDDGVDSPAVPSLLRELSAVAHVRAVLPASECSWAGKVLSRFGVLEAAPCGGVGAGSTSLRWWQTWRKR